MVSENKLLGRSIMISILDMVKKNPYTRLPDDFNENYCRDHSLRLFQNEERFKLLDIKAYQKCKMITQLIRTNIEERLEREWQASGTAVEFNSLPWPKEVRKITAPEEYPGKESKSIKKSLRVKTEGRENASKSLTKPRKHMKPQTETRENQV